MTTSYSKSFIKQAKILDKTTRIRLLNRIELFTNDPLNPVLNNHPLKGKYKIYRSINVTGDIRALYLVRDDTVVFVAVRTHSQLYW